MKPEQLADLLASLDAAAENQDRMAKSLEHNTALPGFQYSSGRAAGLRMAISAVRALTSGES